MANNLKTAVTTLPATKTAILTCVAGTQVAATDVILNNPTGTARSVSLFFYTSTDATERPLPAGVALVASTGQYRYPGKLFLQPGDEIRALPDAAGAVVAAVTHAVTTASTPIAKGFTPRGTYAAGTTYATNDLVTFNGLPYVSRVDGNVGNQPDTATAFWMNLFTVNIAYASASDVRAGTAANLAVTPKATFDSLAFNSLGSIAGTINLAFTAGFNQTGTASGNITLGQHTGGVDGEPVQFEIVQPASGGPYTLAANTTYNKFPGGTPFTLSTAAGARDILYGTTRVIGGTTLAHWTGFGKDIR